MMGRFVMQPRLALRLGALAVALPLALAGCRSAGTAPTVSVGGEAVAKPTAEEDSLYLALIRGMIERDQAQAALAFIDEYLRRHPNDVEGLTLKGEALLRTNQAPEADKVYIELDRRRVQPVAAFGLGQVRAQVGDWAGAVPQYARAADAAPTDTRVLNNYGFALLKTSDFQKAYGILARASQLSPQNQQIRTNFLIAALNSGREAEADGILQPLAADQRPAVLSFARSWKP